MGEREDPEEDQAVHGEAEADRQKRIEEAVRRTEAKAVEFAYRKALLEELPHLFEAITFHEEEFPAKRAARAELFWLVSQAVNNRLGLHAYELELRKSMASMKLVEVKGITELHYFDEAGELIDIDRINDGRS